MSYDLWTLVRFIHVAAAILWVGGQLTISFIVRPVAAKSLDGDTRRTVIAAVGSRFGRITSAVLLPVLLASGLALTYHHGVARGALSIGSYATTLTFKVVLALASFALAALHGMTAARASSRAIRMIGLTGVVVSLTVVGLAVSLVP